VSYRSWKEVLRTLILSGLVGGGVLAEEVQAAPRRLELWNASLCRISLICAERRVSMRPCLLDGLAEVVLSGWKPSRGGS